MTQNFTSIIRILALLFLTAFSVNADSWLLPKTRRYYSANKKYYVEVVPKKLESQLKYFEDKVKNKKNAGAVKEAKNNYAKGTLFKQNEDGSSRKLHSFPLVNEVSPVEAIVSNNGSYIATFDNWHGVGYGPDAVVIYHSDGSVVRQLALEDFLTENDIATFPETASSRWWGHNHYFEEKTNLLVLRIVSSNESPGGASDFEGAKFYEVKLNPATGILVGSKRDLLPRWEVQASSGVDSGVVNDITTRKPPDPECPTDPSISVALTRLSSAELIKNARSSPLPKYPPIARLARIEGTVIVEVLLSEKGEVVCARTLSGHMLLRHAAATAAKGWSFAGSELSGKLHQSIGNIAFHFKYVLVQP